MGALNTSLRTALRRFGKSRSGNVAMIWAICGTVLIGLVGLTIDFTRAQTVRSAMQNAADGAVLVAERSSHLPLPERTAAARGYFDAALGDQPLTSGIDFLVTPLTGGGHRVTASGEFDNGLSLVATLLGSANGNWRVAVSADAVAQASPPIEVALVLDNTGSMKNDMETLRSAAGDLVDSLYELGGETVSIALVPFVAQVNVGSAFRNAAWMDSGGISPYNGVLLEDRQIALLDWTSAMGPAGVNGCQNLSRQPWGTRPDSDYPNASADGYNGPYLITWVYDPGLLGIGAKCRAFTPAGDYDAQVAGVNYFELFDQMPGAPWRGCVEARTAHNDLDITDEPASAGNPETLFSPYFWVDTGGDAGASSSNNSSTLNYRSSNTYLTDTRGRITRIHLAAPTIGTLADNFNTSALNNSTGTISWSGTPWVETGDNSNTNSASAGQIRIDNPSTTNAMMFRDDDNDSGNGTARIQRTVNLANATSATISFSYVETGFDSGETVTVLFAADGTNFNQTIITINMNSNTGSVSNVALTGPFTANSAIRFVVAGTNNNSSGADTVAIDNLVISASILGTVAMPTMTNGSTHSPSWAEQRRAWWFNVFKWRGDTGAQVSFDHTPDENGNTRGPNRGCPTPIVPLSTPQERDAIDDGVDDMVHWSGGGTNQVEGLVWGWRVLSPGAPFTEGRPYNDPNDPVRKVIVLMSDGQNTNVGNDAVWSSDYSGLNYLGLWSDYDDGSLLGMIAGALRGILDSIFRRDIDNADEFVDYINDRERLLCENIKDEGIEIYTVIFRETDGETRDLMRDCATSPNHYFTADNAAELNAAFTAIGSGIGNLRLTQ